MTMDDVQRLALLIVADIVTVAGLSVAIGATAPRWPARWLARDRFPLRLRPWETPAAYRRLGVPRLARRLPELGATFGGTSKARLPGRDAASLRAYLVEVRRAEWVHALSMLTWIPLAAFNPWWMTAAFAVIVTAVNLPFLAVLRHNRVRLARLVEAGSAGGTGKDPS